MQTRALDMLNQIRDQSDLENDASYHVHPNGEITVVDLPATNVPNDPPTTRTRRQVLATPDSVDSNGVPIHHSRPSSNNKLFLNFQGEIVTGTVWNNPAQFDTETEGGGYDPITVRPFYASDNVPGPIQIAPENASRITDIWMKVAEDFRPFDVDVTTEVPVRSFLPQPKPNAQSLNEIFSGSSTVELGVWQMFNLVAWIRFSLYNLRAGGLRAKLRIGWRLQRVSQQRSSLNTRREPL